MAAHHFDSAKASIDGTLGTVAVSSPIWLQWLENGLGLFMLVGGAALLVLRLAIAWREWRDGRKPRP